MPIIRHGPGTPAIVDAVSDFDHTDKHTAGQLRFGWIGDAVAIQEVKTLVTEPKAGMNEQWFSQMGRPPTVLYILVSSNDSPSPWLLNRKSAGDHLCPFD